MSNKSLKDWLAEGEQLHAASMQEYQQLTKEMEDLERRLAAKKEEVNQIAQVVNKPGVEGATRRVQAELVDDRGPNSVPNNPNTIARALSGRALGR